MVIIDSLLKSYFWRIFNKISCYSFVDPTRYVAVLFASPTNAYGRVFPMQKRNNNSSTCSSKGVSTICCVGSTRVLSGTNKGLEKKAAAGITQIQALLVTMLIQREIGMQKVSAGLKLSWNLVVGINMWGDHFSAIWFDGNVKRCGVSRRKMYNRTYATSVRVPVVRRTHRPRVLKKT